MSSSPSPPPCPKGGRREAPVQAFGKVDGGATVVTTFKGGRRRKPVIAVDRAETAEGDTIVFDFTEAEPGDAPLQTVKKMGGRGRIVNRFSSKAGAKTRGPAQRVEKQDPMGGGTITNTFF